MTDKTSQPAPTQQKRAGFGLICFNEGEQAFKNFVSSLSSLMMLALFFWLAVIIATEKAHTWMDMGIGLAITSGLLFGLVVTWISATRLFYPAFNQVFSNKDVRNLMHYFEALVITFMLMTVWAFLYVLSFVNVQQMMPALHAVVTQQIKVEQPATSKNTPHRNTP